MDAFILLKLLCSIVVFTRASNANSSCTSSKCNILSPEIRSPFRIQGLQPHECGLPGFTLFCQENTTTIHFHGNRDLFVKAISYDTRRMSLVDPKNCVHEVFLNLNLSLTPFRYYYTVHQYRYINCSAKLVGFEPVPCLSGSNHHVYVVDPSVSLPVSCSSIRTVAIPFSYSPYLSDSSFGLGLTWRIDEAATKSHFLYAVLSIIAFIFIVGKLLYSFRSKYEEKVDGMLRDVEIDNLLGEYEAVDAPRL